MNPFLLVAKKQGGTISLYFKKNKWLDPNLLNTFIPRMIFLGGCEGNRMLSPCLKQENMLLNSHKCLGCTKK